MGQQYVDANSQSCRRAAELRDDPLQQGNGRLRAHAGNADRLLQERCHSSSVRVFDATCLVVLFSGSAPGSSVCGQCAAKIS